ncbi:MAG: hypothetical protein ACOYOU_11130, partial [Kiritimatiellia bacterium]
LGVLAVKNAAYVALQEKTMVRAHGLFLKLHLGGWRGPATQTPPSHPSILPSFHSSRRVIAITQVFP